MFHRLRRLANNKDGMWNRWRRVIRFRLVIPVLRSRHSPQYTARGVFIGLVVGMTPTVGIQMPIVALIWIAIRVFFKPLSFNAVTAMLWTWVSNLFTMGPMYYVFLLTGELIMGRWSRIGSYEIFIGRLDQLLSTDATWFQSIWIYALEMFVIWGVPMFVGCIPWALLTGWLGYRWSLAITLTVNARREQRERDRQNKNI